LQVGFEFAGGLFAAGAALKETAPTHGLLLCGLQDTVDGADELLPATCLPEELFSPSGGELIKAGLAIVLGRAPFRTDPTAILQPVQGGVKRTVLNLQDFVGAVLDNVGNGVTVGWAEKQCLQDQQIERALQEIGFERRCASFWHGCVPQKIIDWNTRR
jgi:hypothetical protein